MSLFAFAEEYVTEYYNDRVEEPLSDADKAALTELITKETHRLHSMLMMACESWATIACNFEPEESG